MSRQEKPTQSDKELETPTITASLLHPSNAHLLAVQLTLMDRPLHLASFRENTY